MPEIFHRQSGIQRLAFCMSALIFIWLVVLPRLSEWSYVQQRIEGYNKAGIDPNAFFYSDHPSMRDIERKMDSVVNGSKSAFWSMDGNN